MGLKQKTLVLCSVIFFVFLITFFIIYEIVASKDHQKTLSEQQVIEEAKAHFKGMVDTRTWNAQYGGVYVKANKTLQPNPYLKDNTLLTKNNEVLVKINPAWMTRQISEISNKKGDYHFKITSLKPLNPSNQADAFESHALKYFEKNEEEKYFYNFDMHNKSFNFMGALPTTKACLKCHEHQGYKIGDVRGGIRVSIPLTLHQQHMNLLEKKTQTNILTVSLSSLFLLIVILWFINMSYKRRYEIENANEILEEKVQTRTHDLEVVISNEQHLKDVLKIMTEVNETLITSYSIKSTLKNTTTKLSSNEHYSLVISGLIYDDILEIVSQSSTAKNILESNIVSLDENEKSNFFSQAIIKATRLKHPISEKISSYIQRKEENRREDDLNLKWMIVLPLLHGFDNDVYGIVTVFSSKEDGFELEEMKILENMAHDISIALYSHKQKDSILAMEKEKTANYEETILAFVNIIEQRDTYTAGHTIRVAEYCALIAKQMGLSEEDITILEKAAILHDIGKVATPDTILLKPGKLSHLEYELIKQHSEVGADMLERITIYKNLAKIIRFHHARYDGKGYPKTDSPDDIPMLSHIMIVADAFDAMTTNRIYRPRKNITEALVEIEDARGTQFHPDIVDAASIALKNVNVGITTQLPSSELEKRRMSYFFHDGLTGIYNEDYLHTILNTTHTKYECLHIIDIKKFTQYNKENGWEQGNILLKDFAQFLKESFPDAIIIRYHGDDFIILHQLHREISLQEIIECEEIKHSALKIGIKHYELDQNFHFDDFKKLEDQ